MLFFNFEIKLFLTSLGVLNQPLGIIEDENKSSSKFFGKCIQILFYKIRITFS